MHPADVGKLSELAKSLYQHRLVGSMDDAFEMAKKMMLTDHPGENMSAKVTHSVPEPVGESQNPLPGLEVPLTDEDLEPSPSDAVSTESVVLEHDEPLVPQNSGSQNKDPPVTLSELKHEVKEAVSHEESTEKTMERLGNEIKSLKEQLVESTKEFDEIKEYLKDIEDLAKQGKEAKKKEEVGVKIAETAEKPVTEFDDKLEIS